jgi:hypothetical protein
MSDRRGGNRPLPRHRVRNGLSKTPERVPPPHPGRGWTYPLLVERNSKFARSKSRARKVIEQFCMDEYRMRCFDKHHTRYEIVMPFAPGPRQESAIEDMLAEMHHTTDLCHCWIEAFLHDAVTDA